MTKGVWTFVYLCRRLLRLFALSICVFGSITSYAEWPKQSCSSPHRLSVTITAGDSDHDTESLIMLVDADFPSDYVFSASGDDVRIFQSDDITPVEFVVAKWDSTARSATLYILHPSIAANTTETVYIYLGDNSLGTASDVNLVFPDVGLRLHSRVSTVDPTDAASARIAFEGATTDVTNSVIPTVSGLNNQAVGGTNGDYGWCVSAILEVTPATSGVWGFRYGADFGRGGHLYVSEEPLEEDWNDDLWWANNYANTAETLEGTIDLSPGFHRYEALGFEGCCDGPTGFQAMAPGGPWQDLSSTNFPMRAARCVQSIPVIAVTATESCTAELSASKEVSMDASSPETFSIPGAIIRYDIHVENPGQTIDAGTLVLTDIYPGNVALITTGAGAFMFSDGAVPSGLGFSYLGASSTTDSVEFSVDGTDFTYTPSAVDADVTHVRFRPSGAFSPNNAGDMPSFTISILGEVL